TGKYLVELSIRHRKENRLHSSTLQDFNSTDHSKTDKWMYIQTIPRLLVDTHSDVIATNIFLPAQDSLLRVRMMIV
ncbi:MAG: hypothetical protein QF408_13575, partial [Pirellulales bacterium]|nr:hypothetical protein [Pirellulales bacterium]